MAKIELTYEINQKRWVKPLVYASAHVSVIFGVTRFPRWFTDFIVNHGFKIEYKE